MHQTRFFIKRRFILLTITLLGGTLCFGQDAKQGEALDALLRRFVAEQGIPAMAVGVMDRGVIQLSAGYGRIAGADGGAQVTDTTLFRVASLTKLFTAQAIMQLVDAGKLSLKDDVGAHIHQLRGSGVQIQHLLTHSSGLMDLIRPKPFAHADSFDSYLDKALQKNPKLRPNQKFNYSDTGFNILGEIVSRLSGKPYEKHLEDAILGPSEMTSTGFYSGEGGIRPEAPAFRNGGSLPQNQRRPFDPSFSPSEGLISNVSDLMRWSKLWLDKDQRLLEQESYRVMLTPRRTTNWGDTKIGLAWFIRGQKDNRAIYHMGGIRGYESILAMFPAQRRVIIVLANRNDVPRWELVELIQAALN